MISAEYNYWQFKNSIWRQVAKLDFIYATHILNRCKSNTEKKHIKFGDYRWNIMKSMGSLKISDGFRPPDYWSLNNSRWLPAAMLNYGICSIYRKLYEFKFWRKHIQFGHSSYSRIRVIGKLQMATAAILEYRTWNPNSGMPTAFFPTSMIPCNKLWRLSVYNIRYFQKWFSELFLKIANDIFKIQNCSRPLCWILEFIVYIVSYRNRNCEEYTSQLAIMATLE